MTTTSRAPKPGRALFIAVLGLAAILPSGAQDPVTTGAVREKLAEGTWLGAISPDGSFFTYTDWTSGDLAVHDLETGESRRLTHKGSWATPESAVGVHAISPDGRLVAYCWQGPGPSELRLVDLEGSEPRVLRSGWVRPQDWSRDGRFVLATTFGSGGTSRMVLVSVADGSEQVLKTFGAASAWDEGHVLALSPDGRFVVYDSQSNPESPERDIHVLSVDGSSDSPLVEHAANDYVLGWAPQGDRVLFASDRGGKLGAWAIEVVDGRSRGVPALVESEIPPMGGGFAHDGSYYYSYDAWVNDVYLARIDSQTGRTQQPERLIEHVSFGSSAEFSPDGRYLAYVWGEGRYPDPFVLGVRTLETGEELRHLLHMRRMGGHALQPQWSRDGESLFGSGRRGLVRIDAVSGETELLVECGDGSSCIEWPVWSSDGRAIFTPRTPSGQGAPRSIVTRDLGTGRENEIHRVEPPAALSQLSVSRDGQQLAFVWSDIATGTSALQVIGTAGGDEVRELLRVPRPNGDVPGFDLRNGAIRRPAWSPDGRYVLFARIGAGRQSRGFELWRVPSEGGKPESLGLVMDGLTPSGLSVHPDGRRIAFTAGSPTVPETWVMRGLLTAQESVR